MFVKGNPFFNSKLQSGPPNPKAELRYSKPKKKKPCKNNANDVYTTFPIVLPAGIYECHVPVWAIFQETLLLHSHFLCFAEAKYKDGSWRQIWVHTSSADDVIDTKWIRLCDVILSLMSLAEGQVHTVIFKRWHLTCGITEHTLALTSYTLHWI